ncbi:WAS/WASL-interacting protein family member 2-like [Gracilinanus agilis]|uniref:WAS/WASL-interacting protein family member 2-like n=1 Tax=Gracilinanus agilis TaxID=191870 RepID=UPI001CFF247F|nr:WAS/WASL-interacting protein family member 2-like [Gracilinanus agilis]
MKGEEPPWHPGIPEPWDGATEAPVPPGGSSDGSRAGAETRTYPGAMPVGSGACSMMQPTLASQASGLTASWWPANGGGGRGQFAWESQPRLSPSLPPSVHALEIGCGVGLWLGELPVCQLRLGLGSGPSQASLGPARGLSSRSPSPPQPRSHFGPGTASSAGPCRVSFPCGGGLHSRLPGSAPYDPPATHPAQPARLPTNRLQPPPPPPPPPRKPPAPHSSSPAPFTSRRRRRRHHRRPKGGAPGEGGREGRKGTDTNPPAQPPPPPLPLPPAGLRERSGRGEGEGRPPPAAAAAAAAATATAAGRPSHFTS